MRTISSTAVGLALLGISLSRAHAVAPERSAEAGLAQRAYNAASRGSKNFTMTAAHACYKSELCARECKQTLAFIVAQRPQLATLEGLDPAMKQPELCADAASLRGAPLAAQEQWARERLLASMAALRAKSVGETRDLIDCATERLGAGPAAACVRVEPAVAARGLHDIVSVPHRPLARLVLFKLCSELGECAGQCRDELTALSLGKPTLPAGPSKCEAAPRPKESAQAWVERAKPVLQSRVRKYFEAIGPRLSTEARPGFTCDLTDMFEDRRPAECPSGGRAVGQP